MRSPTKKLDPVPQPLGQSTHGRGMFAEHDAPTLFSSSEIYQLAVIYSHPSVGQLQNVMHFAPSSTPAAQPYDAANDLIFAFIDSCQDDLLICLGTDLILAGYQARRVTGGSPTVTQSVLLHGTGSSVINDTAIACNIAFVPASAPWQYGHFYVPGVPDAEFGSNNFTSTYTGHADNLAGDLIATMTHLGGTLGITWNAGILERSSGALRPIARFIRNSRPVSIGRRLRPWLFT